MASIEEKVTKLVEPIIEKSGYELYDVEYAKEGKGVFLNIIKPYIIYIQGSMGSKIAVDFWNVIHMLTLPKCIISIL